MPLNALAGRVEHLTTTQRFPGPSGSASTCGCPRGMRCESLDGWRRSGKSPFLCLYFAVRRVAPEHMYFCVISVGIFNSRGNINLIILTLVIHEPGFLNKDDEIVPARR